MDINKWGNKQLWRVKMTWQVFQFISPVAQVVLLFAIAINMDSTSDIFILGFLGVLGLNIVGYILDKTGVFIEHRRRGFEIYEKMIQGANAQYLAAWFAKLQDMSAEEREEVLNRARTVLGITEEEDATLILGG